MIRKSHLCFAVSLIIVLSTVLGGCWDQVEIKERTIVIGLGIDKIPGPNPILLTAQIVNLPTTKDSGGGATGLGETGATNSGSSNSVCIVTSKGKSFFDAIYNFLKYSSRLMTFSHNRVIILGRELAQAGITGVCDDMARDYQFRRTNWILVAQHTAREILGSRTDQGTIPAKELDHLLIDLAKNALIQPAHVGDLLTGLSAEARVGTVPVIDIEKPGLNPTPRITITRTAVFKNDRLTDMLSIDESQGLLWLRHEKKGGALVFPFQSGGALQPITVEIVDGTSWIRPRIIKDQIVMEMVCTGKGILRETENLANNPATVRQLEHRVNRLLRQRVERTIQKAQQIKADFPGFATLIHGAYPERWRRINRDWEREFPRLKSRVVFRIRIVHFGIVKDTILKAGPQE